MPASIVPWLLRARRACGRLRAANGSRRRAGNRQRPGWARWLAGGDGGRWPQGGQPNPKVTGRAWRRRNWARASHASGFAPADRPTLAVCRVSLASGAMSRVALDRLATGVKRTAVSSGGDGPGRLPGGTLWVVDRHLPCVDLALITPPKPFSRGGFCRTPRSLTHYWRGVRVCSPCFRFVSGSRTLGSRDFGPCRLTHSAHPVVSLGRPPTQEARAATSRVSPLVCGMLASAVPSQVSVCVTARI
jgi:hypothetical protein